MSKRILLTSLLVTIFVLLFFAVSSIEIYHGQAVTAAENALETYMNVYEDEQTKYTADADGAESLSKTLNGSHVTFFTAGGAVIADTAGLEAGETPATEEVTAAIADGTGMAYRPADVGGKTEVFYCKRQGDILVRISELINSPSVTFVSALPTLIVFIVIDILLCLLFTWLATSFILRPVKELAQAAVGTDKEVKAKYKELQPVADVFNQKSENVRHMQKSKDEFISNVTHEMNTPLTSIRGFAELIASGNLPKEKAQSAAKTIVSQSDRLSAMISQILHFSAIDDDMLEPYDVDVSALVREQLETFDPLLRDKKLTLRQEIESGVTVKSRHERITEIVNNLVSNAIKYNKPNGTVTVTLRGKKLTVEDTGIGIAQDELPHIFSRFYTVDKSHGESVGFGLGLSIVRKLCDRSGWKLSVDSTPGEGTVFTVEF